MVRILEAMKQMALKEQVPIVEHEGLLFLSNYIMENKCYRILEIGTAIGYSSINFAILDDLIHIDTVERDNKMYQLAKKNIFKANLETRINVFFEDALNFETTKQYDLIFIDAAKSQYQKFFEKFAPNLSETGVIVCDNLNFHGLVNNHTEIKNRNTKQLVKKIVRFRKFLENNKYFSTKFYEVGDGMSISRKVKL